MRFVTRAHYEEVTAQWREIASTQGKMLREAQERYDALLKMYHELRVTGANVPERLPDPPKSPLDALGPLTKAALREMSIGLTATSRRAMEAKALALHAEGMKDPALAAMVQIGETSRNGNGNGRRL